MLASPHHRGTTRGLALGLPGTMRDRWGQGPPGASVMAGGGGITLWATLTFSKLSPSSQGFSAWCSRPSPAGPCWWEGTQLPKPFAAGNTNSTKHV